MRVEPFLEGLNLVFLLCKKNEAFVRYIDVVIGNALTLTLGVDFVIFAALKVRL